MTWHLLSGLGWYPPLEWNPRSPGADCPSPCDSLAVSTVLAPPHLEQKLKQEGCNLQVQQEDSGRFGPQADIILFLVLLPSLLGPVQAAHLLVIALWIAPPFSCKYPCSLTYDFLSTQALSFTCRWPKEGKTKEGSAQIILSKNVCIPSPPRPCPESSISLTRWLSSLAGEKRYR